ncbi:PAS domain-containing protein [Nocardioides sp. AE5]|uniref:PAS domain-containing protein n=1 Tax=Nocardioides sp. AE5 TaxID=2962573 RepID=UPI00288251E0|nr:PAS domain-containing protein [Nocardioides sp. AE5]MDT0202521.1 PAS domain-containing protein [Nocardioides sp. AE5]
MTTLVREAAVVPSGVERKLAPEAIIVSKTDPKGLLTYVNDTFLEISAYEEADLIGRPHNVIRHPDMPRAVFKLLWDTLANQDELFAYIVNLSADGSHYWVLAHVTPSRDETGQTIGFHSNRRAPSTAAISQVVPIYQRVRAIEDAQPNARAATEAGARALEQVLADRGQTYDEFVWHLINLEDQP